MLRMIKKIIESIKIIEKTPLFVNDIIHIIESNYLKGDWGTIEDEIEEKRIKSLFKGFKMNDWVSALTYLFNKLGTQEQILGGIYYEHYYQQIFKILNALLDNAYEEIQLISNMFCTVFYDDYGFF